MYSKKGVVSCTLSDHCLVYAARKTVKTKSKVTFIEARSYRKFDQCTFANDLANEDWSSILECASSEEAWDLFYDLLLPICDKHAPVKKTRVTDKQPTWINKEYLDLRCACQNARSKTEKTGQLDDWAEAKRLRNRLNYLADRLKRQDMNNRISDSKDDPRGLWKNLKTLLPGKKQNTISSLETESGTVTNDTEIANAINNFIATIGQKLASKFEGSENTTTSTFDVQSHDNPSFSFSNVTVSQVLKQLKKLDVNKATGLDNMGDSSVSV